MTDKTVTNTTTTIVLARRVLAAEAAGQYVPFWLYDWAARVLRMPRA